jgi:hypothetical protein
LAEETVTRLHHIYVLIDPRSSLPRYVGVTVQRPTARLVAHCAVARNRPRTLKDQWVRELLANNIVPRLEVVESTTEREREIFWLEHYRSAGYDLLNIRIGSGEGHLGLGVSTITKERIRDAALKRWANPVFKNAMRQRMMGHPVSDITKERIAAAKIGRKLRVKRRPNSMPRSPEAREKSAQAMRGRRWTFAPGTHITHRNPELFRGERKWAAKLTEAKVREMRIRYAEGGISQFALAREYGIAEGSAWAILRGKKWKHVK